MHTFPFQRILHAQPFQVMTPPNHDVTQGRRYLPALRLLRIAHKEIDGCYALVSNPAKQPDRRSLSPGLDVHPAP